MSEAQSEIKSAAGRMKWLGIKLLFAGVTMLTLGSAVKRAVQAGE